MLLVSGDRQIPYGNQVQCFPASPRVRRRSGSKLPVETQTPKSTTLIPRARGVSIPRRSNVPAQFCLYSHIRLKSMAVRKMSSTGNTAQCSIDFTTGFTRQIQPVVLQRLTASSCTHRGTRNAQFRFRFPTLWNQKAKIHDRSFGLPNQP